MIDNATRQFIDGHRQCDIHQLALQARSHGDVDMAVAVEQIAGWQKARTKIPSWASHDDIVYPAHLSLEQCSSEQTAGYKQRLCRRLLHDFAEGRHESMADLTGGFGVDFAWLCSLFDKGIYVERQERLCACARHNFEVLGLTQAEVVEDDGQTVLDSLPHQQLIFVDPARRDSHGGRTFAIDDCTPDVLQLLSTLLQKADIVMLKLSPMLDWRKAVGDLNNVNEVHIVSVDNECKELLLILSKMSTPLRIFCVNNDEVFEYSLEEPVDHISPIPHTPLYLFEPNASIMKAGCFELVEQRFEVAQLDRNSHLFVSDTEKNSFPGRQFIIERRTSMNKRELKEALGDIDKANLAVRNFPMTVAELRKRLKLKEGGDVYIFATTVANEGHQLFVCRKKS